LADERLGYTFVPLNKERYMTLSRRLREARLAAGMTQGEVAKKAGVSQPLYNGLERGVYSRSKHLIAIARALNVRPEALTGETVMHKDSAPNMDVGFTFREVPVVGKAQLGPDGFWEAEDYPPGHGAEYVAWPTKDMNAYSVRVEGDSMSPRIRHGERVIVEPNSCVQPGDEALIRTTDGRCMIKVFLYERDGRIYLDSINDTHPPVSLDKIEVERFHFVAGIAKRSLVRTP
jgi:phage repressor protein C with HTH and peptisase S24 domain